MQFPSNVFSLLIAYQIVIADNGAILFYSGPPGPETLVGSISPTRGVDRFGNSYPAAFQWDMPLEAEGAYFNINSVVPAISFYCAFTDEGNPSVIQEVTGSDSGYLNITGPTNNIDNIGGGIRISSSNTDQTQIATVSLLFNNGAYETVSYNGVKITAGNVVAVHPGSGTSEIDVAVAETWQVPVLNSGWTTVGTNTPARFRMEPYGDGGGTVRLDGELITQGAGPWPAGTDLFNVGAGYTPASGHMFVNKSSIVVGAGVATINVTSSGNVVNGEAFTAAGQSLYLDGMTFPMN